MRARGGGKPSHSAAAFALPAGAAAQANLDGRLHGVEADFAGTVSALTGGITFSW